MKTIKLLLLATVLIGGTTLSFAQVNTKSLEKQAIAASSNIAGSAKDGVSTVYNDSKEGVKEIYSQIKSASPKAAGIIQNMADKLEVGVDAVWKILVRQQLVWSICFLILTLSSIINWYTFYNKYIKTTINIIGEPIIGRRSTLKYVDNPDFDLEYYNRNKQHVNSSYGSDRAKTEVLSFRKAIEHAGEEDYIMEIPLTEAMGSFKYLHLLICIGLSVLSIYHFGAMMTGFINPEFGAMKNIMEFAITLK
jgi:hypothetical protein